MKVHLVYFSATYTTRNICRALAHHLSHEVVEYDLTNYPSSTAIDIPSDELLLLGMPVYAGRIPEMAAPRLDALCGHQSRAIAVAVYGNRHYDSALVEMKQIVESKGFTCIAAAAFIAQHSIFPTVATGRPDAADYERIQAFATACAPLLTLPVSQLPSFEVPGPLPLPPYKHVPFYPVADDTCTLCGRCAVHCPTHAIAVAHPQVTDPSLCIACGRCITACPSHSRHFFGEAYAAKSVLFTQANSARREPEWYYAAPATR